MNWLASVLALMLYCLAMPSPAADGPPAQQEFEPKGGTGRVVVMVSGQTGPANYTKFAQAVADQGFHVVLVDGNDFWVKGGAGEGLLKGVITRAQQSPRAVPGKVGVVGFSLGGGPALSYAARMPDLVAGVVAHYPLTSYITQPAVFVSRLKVPVLILAGTFDTYQNCCLIDMARQLAEAGKGAVAPASLEVHEYPGVDHGYNLNTSKRIDISADSLRRTVAHLRPLLGEK